jgi:hypothetical protein
MGSPYSSSRSRPVTPKAMASKMVSIKWKLDKRLYTLDLLKGPRTIASAIIDNHDLHNSRRSLPFVSSTPDQHRSTLPSHKLTYCWNFLTYISKYM